MPTKTDRELAIAGAGLMLALSKFLLALSGVEFRKPRPRLALVKRGLLESFNETQNALDLSRGRRKNRRDTGDS